MNNTSFYYQNQEVKMVNGQKIVRKVSIQNGKGYKSLTHYKKGKKIHTSKKPIHMTHMDMIKIGKFIPNLFGECKPKHALNKTRKLYK